MKSVDVGMIDRKLKLYKRRFDAQLRHVKLILLLYRKTLSYQEWLTLFYDVKSSVLKYPDHFICCELPNKKLTREAVNLVFDGFQKDLHIRQVQAFRDTNKVGVTQS